jgi:hypothetical protein
VENVCAGDIAGWAKGWKEKKKRTRYTKCHGCSECRYFHPPISCPMCASCTGRKWKMCVVATVKVEHRRLLEMIRSRFAMWLQCCYWEKWSIGGGGGEEKRHIPSLTRWVVDVWRGCTDSFVVQRAVFAAANMVWMCVRTKRYKCGRAALVCTRVVVHSGIWCLWDGRSYHV